MEVVGFNNGHLLLMPYEDINGIGVGASVINTKEPLTVSVGPELLGKALDGLEPLDGSVLKTENAYPVDAKAPDALKREIITDVLPLG